MRAFVIVAGSVLVGCSESYEFTVEMKPEGQRLAREVTCVQHKDGQARSSFPQDVEQRIDALYEEGLDQGAARGVFEQRLPGEFGGSGFHQAYASDLGSAAVYSERLQPWRSAWEVVEAIDAAGDRCVDLLLGWLRWELAEFPEFATIADEVDAKLRACVKNEALLLALPQASGPRLGFAEAPGVPLVAHELLMTDLVSLQDLPDLYRLGELEDDEMEGWLLGKLRELLAEGLEIEAAHPAFGFLASPGALVGSWQAWVASRVAEHVADAPDASSNPSDVFQPLLKLTLDWELFADSTRVAVTLETGVEPLMTNGDFDHASGRVSWPAEELADHLYRPLHRYAVWATPDEEAQVRILGRVLLRGEELFDYTLWFAGLSPEESRDWSGQLASLDRDLDLAEQVRRLNLPSRDDEVPRGAELLLAALGVE
jgi:hypothetical protein